MADQLPPNATSQTDSPWPMIGVIVLCFVVGAAILGGFYLATIGAGTKLKLTDADRQVMVTVGDLDALLENLVIRSDAIVESKTRYKDGRVELLSEYDSGEGSQELFLRCSLVVQPTMELAMESYRAQCAAGATSVNSEVHCESRGDVAQWGDQSEFSSLIRSGKAVGGFFVCRIEGAVFTLEILGAGMGDSDQFAFLVEPALERLNSYSP